MSRYRLIVQPDILILILINGRLEASGMESVLVFLSLPTTDLLVLLLHPLSVESKVRLTSRQICRLGRPSGARSSRHVITPATDQATHRGQAQNTHNIQCNPQVHVFPGSSHYGQLTHLTVTSDDHGVIGTVGYN